MSESNSWALNSGRLELGEAELHVWRANLELDESALRQLESTLASDELTRANRFHSERDRNSFVAARGVLRQLLGKYLDRSPAELEFDIGARGKPSVRQEPFERPIQFNISHSHGLALFAFATKRHLGVDVELIRPEFAGQEIARRYFSPHEVMELEALPEPLRPEGFFLCWTRKEAYIKARGEGLHIPLESFHVSLTPGNPASLQSEDRSRWTVRSLRPHPHYAGAVVGEGSDWELRLWDWKPSESG